MSEIDVQLKGGVTTQIPAPVSAGEALKKLDREAAKQALAARVNGREVDLAFTIAETQNGEAVSIEPVLPETQGQLPDRKSTRLNSSHQIISYAVFCLKKKKTSHSHVYT